MLYVERSSILYRPMRFFLHYGQLCCPIWPTAKTPPYGGAGRGKGLALSRGTAHIQQALSLRRQDAPMKQFVLRAQYDAQAKVWFGSNEQLPITTEAPSLDALLARASDIAPEIAVLNGLAQEGERVAISLHTEPALAE